MNEFNKKEEIVRFLESYYKDKIKHTLHFDKPCTVISKRSKVEKFLLNENLISKHAFLPFIGYDIVERRFSKLIENKKTKKVFSNHSYRTGDKNEKNKIKKIRPIHYASHKANLIYAWYAKILEYHYEKKLREYTLGDLKLSDCVLAYRKVTDEEKNSKLEYKEHPRKTNITMAREVFDEIHRRNEEKDGCYVFAYDLEGFFNHLDHTMLKDRWAKILDLDKLPDDHFNLFKSLTKCAHIKKEDLQEFFRVVLKTTTVKISKHHKNSKTGRLKITQKGYQYGRRFTELALKKIIQKYHEPKKFREFRTAFKNKDFRIHTNIDTYGIPQGTPISALLANIYMIDFDIKMLELCKEHNLFYRRYSDDILMILPVDLNLKVELQNKIQGEEFKKLLGSALKIHPIGGGKSEFIDFTLDKARVSYLGFDFDGKTVSLRQSGVAKYYRKSTMWIRSSLRGLIANKSKSDIINRKTHKKKIYELYSCHNKNVRSHNTKHTHGNYITYVYQKSNTVFTQTKYKIDIEKPLRRHINILQRKMNNADMLLGEFLDGTPKDKLEIRKVIK